MPNLIRLLLLTLFLGACQSDDPGGISAPATRQSLLAGKLWRQVALTVDPARPRVLGGSPLTDWYADLPDCDRDNTKLYLPDGTMIFDEGLTRCSPNNPQTLGGTWLFNQDESIITELRRAFLVEIRSYDIVSITPDSLVLRRQEELLGTTYTFRETYQIIN